MDLILIAVAASFAGMGLLALGALHDRDRRRRGPGADSPPATGLSGSPGATVLNYRQF
ncbi:MAG TPA: hypothetical protein VFV11_10045 [Solimonas sp.]|nr:hypothetical protein [Solimonas sp.]